MVLDLPVPNVPGYRSLSSFPLPSLPLFFFQTYLLELPVLGVTIVGAPIVRGCFALDDINPTGAYVFTATSYSSPRRLGWHKRAS